MQFVCKAFHSIYIHIYLIRIYIMHWILFSLQILKQILYIYIYRTRYDRRYLKNECPLFKYIRIHAYIHAMYNIRRKYTVYSVYKVYCTVYNTLYTLYTVYLRRILYIVHCTLYNVQCTHYHMQCTLYIIGPWISRWHLPIAMYRTHDQHQS